MNDKHLAQLEAQLEKLTEGVFARFFGMRLQVHDIALQILRALEANLRLSHDRDSRPIAPNQFTIRVNTEVLEQILNNYPELASALSERIVEIANSAGYRLKNQPQVKFLADPAFARKQIEVTASHYVASNGTTDAMKPIKIASAHPKPKGAQLIISGEQTVTLDQPIIQIGRDPANDIVINNMHVSRRHAQIRLRFGHYMIFDTDSVTGTFINNVQIHEHRLQPGDVIHIAGVTLVYTEDDHQDQDPPTQTINPVL